MMARSAPLPARPRPPSARAGAGSGQLLAPDLLHVVDPGELRAVVVAQAARLVIDDVAQRGQPVGDRQHLVDLLLVLHHRDRDLGVLEHIGHLVGDRVGIDRHRHGAERLRRRTSPSRAAAGCAPMIANLSPRFSPSSSSPTEKARTSSSICAPGPGLPDAEILVAHRGATAARRSGIFDQKLRKRIVAGAVVQDAVPSSKRRAIIARKPRRCSSLAAVDRRACSLRHMK